MKTGWLSPDGRFYECPSYGHYLAARKIIELLGYKTKDERYGTIDDTLLNRGFVRIGICSMGEHGQSLQWTKRLTDFQIKFMTPYFEENDMPVTSYSKMEWEREMYEREMW